MRAHASATSAAVPSNDASVPVSSGQGSASRSTLPDVRTGMVSTTAMRGTAAAGRRSRSVARALLVSSVPSVTT